MSGLRLGSAAAAERFAAVLDGTAERADLPASVAELVTLTERLGTLPRPTMDPAASARIRQRLVAVAAVQPAGAEVEPEPASRAVSWRTRRLLSVAVGTLTGVTAVAGVAVGAANSLPGDPFYGLKRAAERIQLDLAGSPAAKGKRELEFAATRLSELRAIGTRDPHAPAELTDLRSEMTAAESDLRTAAHDSHTRTPLVEFQSQASRQFVSLLQLAEHAPASLLPELNATTTTIAQLVQEARQTAAALALVPPASQPHPKPTAPATRPNGRPHTSHPAGHRSQPVGGGQSGAAGGTSTGPLPSSAPAQSSTPAPTHSLVPSLPLPTPVTSKLKSLVPSPIASITSLLPSLVNGLTGHRSG